MDIRRATLADAEGIATVHVDSWRTTYRNIIPSEFLQNLSYEQRTELWKQNLSKEGNDVFVAVNHDEEIVGFADGGKRESNHVDNSGDLTSIYLLEEYQGKGIGKQLLRRMFLTFKERRYEKVFVEVLEDNKTCTFYEYYGAKQIESEKITIAGAPLNLLIYEWTDLNDVLEKLK